MGNNYWIYKILGSAKYFALFLILIFMFFASGVGVAFLLAGNAEKTEILSGDPTLSSVDVSNSNLSENQKLTINAKLQVNGQLKLAPTDAPLQAEAGTLIFDKRTNTLQYFNGSGFVSLTSQEPVASGVTSLQGQSGAINLVGGSGININGTTISTSGGGLTAVSGTLGQVNVVTVGGIVKISLPQSISTSASPTFGGLAITSNASISGDLSLSSSSALFGNNLVHTGLGQDISINAGNDNIIFTVGGRTFQFPTTGPGSQTICTTGITCVAGGGLSVELAPGSAQTDNTADASIFINDTGGGNLLHLQSSGVDRFVVSSTGTATLRGSIGFSNGSFTTTLGKVNPTANTTINLPALTAGVYEVCTSAGNCAASIAVDSINGFTGVTTVAPTTNQTTVTNSSGTITIGTVQNINTTSSPTFSGLNLTSLAVGGDTINDFSGTGLVVVGNVLQSTLGTSVDLTSEITGILPVANGGTGRITLAGNSLLLGNGTGVINNVTNGSPGECLLSTVGAPAFSTCPGSGGVTSVDGQTGVITINNATGTLGVITIDDATTGQKGIAQFNGTNLSVTAGVVNTIQGISTSASPTFAGLTLSGPLAVTSGGTGSANASGARVNLGAAASGANADITSLNALTAINPGAALTVGSTSQQLILQGNASTVLTSTSGANTTTVGFVSPTANVNINFPALIAGTYQICTTSGNCLGGGAGGANTSLSNLSSVSINTSLLTGSSSIDLGSATNPFRYLYVGGTASNNFQFGGVASAPRTITLPDQSGEVCLDSGNCSGDGSGITTIGALDGGTPSANGASISGANLYLQSASATQPGLVTTGTQTFAGVKTFSDDLIVSGIISGNGSGITDINGSNITTGTVANARLVNSGGLTVTAGTGLTGGGSVVLGSSTTIDLDNTTVVADSYGAADSVATFTVDAQGRLTSASDVLISIDASQVTAGTLGVARGGTGATTFTQYGILYGNSTGALSATGAGTTGQCIIATTGSAPSWDTCPGDGSGITTIGALDGGTPSANGASISGANLYLQSASATQPGLVTTGTQTFAGAKTFNSTVFVGGVSGSSTALRVMGTSNTGFNFDTTGNARVTFGSDITNSSARTYLEDGSLVAGWSLDVSALLNQLTLYGDTGVNIATQSGNIVLGGVYSSTSLLVLDTKTNAGDPTGVNGGTYYNSNAGKFRCYEGSTWKDCIASGNLSSLLTDNIANSWDIQEGTNNYININTTNGSENISFGNSTTNPNFNFLGNGSVTINSDAVIDGVTIDNTNITFTSPYNWKAVQTASSGSNTTSNLSFVTGNSGLNGGKSGDAYIITGNGTGTSTASGSIGIDVGTATGAAGQINIGASNTSAIALGRTGITTTINGSLAVASTIDKSSSGTLSVGTTTATVTTVGRIGGTLNLNGGNNYLNGNTAVTSGYTLSVVSGEFTINGRNTGSNTTLRVNNHTSTGSIFVAQDAATDVFTIADGGAVTVSPTNSTRALRVTTATGGQTFIVDTANQKAAVGAYTEGAILGQFQVVPSNDNRSGLVLSVYSATYSADLLSVMNSSGAVALRFDAPDVTKGGAVKIGSGGGVTSGDTIPTWVVSGSTAVANATGSSGALYLETGDGRGTNGSSGSILLDVGSANGTGTLGNITLGATRASAINLGRTGVTTTNLGSLAVTGTSALNNTVNINGTSGKLSVGDGNLASGNTALTVNNGSLNSNIASFTDNGTEVFGIANNGYFLFKNSSNSATSLRVQNAAGTNLFTVDTQNMVVTVGGTLAYTAGTANTADSVCRNSSGQLAGCTSSQRYKDNVTNLSLGLDELRLLQPVNYRWNTTGKTDVGFIAEQVAQVIPQAVTYDKNGEVSSFNYNTVTALLVSSVKQLDLKVTSIQTRLAKVEQGEFVGNIKVGGKIISYGNKPEVLAQSTAINDAVISVNGTDVAGNVTLKTNEIIPNDMTMKVTFDEPYSGGTPIVTLSPVGKASSMVGAYIVSINNNEMIIGFTNLPESNQNYRFSYQIIQANVAN